MYNKNNKKWIQFPFSRVQVVLGFVVVVAV